MNYKIVKIDARNYSLFDDMIYWRMNGSERLPLKEAFDSRFDAIFITKDNLSE